MLTTVKLNDYFLAWGAEINNIVPNGVPLAPPARAGVISEVDTF